MSFGLLNDEELVKALASDPKMPKSRRVTAIPFIGKDVPSQRSEFSHPDIVIGLTVLAYRYEGLRHVDFKRLMTTLQQNMWDEVGPYHKRPSSKLFAEWVVTAGGKVRGSRLEADNVKKKKEKAHRAELKRQKETVAELNADPFFSDVAVPALEENGTANGVDGAPPPPPADGAVSPAPPAAKAEEEDEDEDAQFSNIQRSHASATDIWPLRLIDFDDDEQYGIVYNLLHRLPEMIYYYLRNFIFPPTMRHQSMKLASSGQDVGGEMLCDHRVGFSGTPSNLIPIELGKLNYEKSDSHACTHTRLHHSTCIDVLWVCVLVFVRVFNSTHSHTHARAHTHTSLACLCPTTPASFYAVYPTGTSSRRTSPFSAKIEAQDDGLAPPPPPPLGTTHHTTHLPPPSPSSHSSSHNPHTTLALVD